MDCVRCLMGSFQKCTAAALSSSSCWQDPRIGSIMSASTLDSEAAFQARAKELGLKDDVIQKLKEGNISSFGNLAFASPYQIGQADEGPLVEALTAILGRAPTVLELVPLRRLWFEASTAAMAELKLKVERSDATEPMRLPIAERTSRLADQKARLVGVSITPELEPSHKLIDTVCQMSLDQQLSWIPWDKLTSRASEVMAASKTDLNITFDVNGALKLQRKFSDGQCSLTGDLQIRQALQRRSLAFDQAKLCSYMAMERYHDELFQAMCREPPPNCLCISMAQVKEADRQLFMRISELTKGALSLRPDGSMPFEGHLGTVKDSAHIQFFMIPQPRPGRFAPYTPPKGTGKGKGKGRKGKGEQAGKSDPSKPSIDIPEGCSAKEPASGKPICFQFNRDGCRFAKAGKRCRRGLHLCWRCFKEHPFSQCTVGGA